jgi:hypothetical protein
MARTTGYAETSRALARYQALWADVTRQVLTAQAAHIEGRLKAEHRWQNRTGAAERALHADVDEFDEGIRVVAGYDASVPYSVYLEYAHQQRFAILEPVMRSQWPAAARAVAAAVRRAAQGAA